MWKYIYDDILQLFTNTWAYFLSKYSAQGRLVRDEIQNTGYQQSGILLVIICLLSCLLYYFYFNKRFGRYYSKQVWFLWMFSTALSVAVATYLSVNSLLKPFVIPATPLVAGLSIINFFYGLILFFILSLIFQLISIVIRRIFAIDLSPMASRTPF